MLDRGRQHIASQSSAKAAQLTGFGLFGPIVVEWVRQSQPSFETSKRCGVYIRHKCVAKLESGSRLVQDLGKIPRLAGALVGAVRPERRREDAELDPSKPQLRRRPQQRCLVETCTEIMGAGRYVVKLAVRRGLELTAQVVSPRRQHCSGAWSGRKGGQQHERAVFDYFDNDHPTYRWLL
jgi:hypothetical protein